MSPGTRVIQSIRWLIGSKREVKSSIACWQGCEASGRRQAASPLTTYAMRRIVHHVAKPISASAAPPKSAVSISCSGQK